MSGKGAVGSKKSSRSSGIQVSGLRHTVEDESCMVISNDIRMLLDSDRRYIRVGSGIILLTIIAASSVVAFSIYNLYFQFRLQEMGLKSVPYIASIIIVLAISSAAVCAVVYNSPRLGRIRRASEENRKWLISCKEDMVRSMVGSIERNADVINAGKEDIKGIYAEEAAIVRRIEELRSIHELYSKVHELKKIKREAMERCLHEAHEVVAAMRDDFSASSDYYGKLLNNKNTIRGNLRESMELVRRSIAKLNADRAALTAKREEYRAVLVDLEVASAKVNSLRIERGEDADRSQSSSSAKIEEREEYEGALKAYNDKKKLSDKLSKEVDAMQLRVSELKRDIDFLNDDIRDMKAELDGISEKMDNVEKSLSAREANFGGAIEFRDSISQDLMLDQIKLAETFEGPWNAAVDQLSSASNFFGIAERKRKVADDMKSAREKSFKAYIGLSSIFSETSSSVINGSQYLKAVKRRDFRAQMGDEWSELDLSTLEQESEIEATPTTSAESAESESAQDDVIVIREVEESTEPVANSESRDVTRETEASTSSGPAATSSAPASINSTPGNKHLIAVESTDIAREKAVSYRSFFSLKKKSPTTEGNIDDKDIKTEATPLTGSFFSFRKKSLTEDSGIGEKKEVEGTFASWRKYFASVTGTGDANGKEDTSSKKPASSKKKVHTLEGHTAVKEVERSAPASSAAPVEEAKVSMVSDNNKENAHILVEAKAEGVSLQQINGKKAV